MSALRQQQQQWAPTNNVEEQTPPAQECLVGTQPHIGVLEAQGGYRNMNESFQLGCLLKTNRFAPLMEKDDYNVNFPNLATSSRSSSPSSKSSSRSFTTPLKVKTAPLHCTRARWPVASTIALAKATPVARTTALTRATPRKWDRRSTTRATILEKEGTDAKTAEGTDEVNGVEAELNINMLGNHVDLTIDSGAAEHVVGAHDIPTVPIQKSEAAGTEYIMANGKRITN